MEKLLLTPREAAATLGIGRTRIYDLIARGVVPSVRIGRSVRVPADALREWIARELAAVDSSAAEIHSGAGKRIGGRDGERQAEGKRPV